MSNNPYLSGEFSEHEGARLRTMDDVFAEAARDDLLPVLGRAAALLDIGAGTGLAIERQCTEADVTYVALDASAEFLEARSTPLKVRGLSEALPLVDGAFDATYSRAVTAWSADPKRAILEQLRVTRDVAVFSEFDWSRATVTSDSEAVRLAGNALKALMLSVLTRRNFKPRYGSILGAEIDAVAPVHAPDYQRIETRHQPSPGDHRDILLQAIRTLTDQAGEKLRAVPFTGDIQEDIATIEAAPPGSIAVNLPALVTQTVYLPESWRSHDGE